MQSGLRRDRALIVLLMAGLLANIGAMAVAKGRAYTVPPPTPLPVELAGWKGTSIPTLDSTKAILPHAQITSTHYEQNGQMPLDLVVISSRDPGDMHTPERCFTGFGFEIYGRDTQSLRLTGPNAGEWTMNRMLVKDAQGEQIVLYTYDGVPKVGSSTMLTRVLMKLGGASRDPAYFIRLSTPTGGDTKGAEARLMDFAGKLMEVRRTWQTPATNR